MGGLTPINQALCYDYSTPRHFDSRPEPPSDPYEIFILGRTA